ncbi:hypothetical protein BKA70DRAFT_1512839 [Coprinopsis sp. MPI-PUGE-AT-0042]|nr:hypothetical protein BKA70DRAFT_1512839 [Coprinopsis sp. MPI-PUGE-AT-0042]
MHSRLIQVQRSARQDRYLLFELGKIRLLLKAHVFLNTQTRDHASSRLQRGHEGSIPESTGIPSSPFRIEREIMGRWIGPEGTQHNCSGLKPFYEQSQTLHSTLPEVIHARQARLTSKGFYTPVNPIRAIRTFTHRRLLLTRESRIMTIFTSPSNVPMRNTELIWVCDPALGVIHTQGCAVCSTFRSHFIEASSTPHDHTFQHAIMKRDAKTSQQRVEDLSDSRRLQHKQDRTRMYRYRHERDEARAKAARQEEELERLRAQLIEMQDAVVAMQQAYEDQLSSLVTSEVTSDESDVDMDIPPTVEPDPVLVIVGEAEQVDGSGLLVAPSVQVPPPRIVIDLTQTSSEEHIAESSSDAQSDRDSGYPTSESSDSIIILDGPPDPIPSTSYSLQEIEEFVTIARDSKRSGHKEALATIESFYAKAKATPRRLRNSTQTYILLKWKSLAKPAIQLDTSSLPAKPCPTLVVPSFSLRRPDLLAQLPPSPSLANVPEIIVDASFTGIGFMCRHVDKLS